MLNKILSSILMLIFKFGQEQNLDKTDKSLL